MRTKDNELVNRIKLYIEEQIDRRGRMPTIRDIAEALDVGKSSVQRYLEYMVEQGILARGEYGYESIEQLRTERTVSVAKLGYVPCGPLSEEYECISNFLRMLKYIGRRVPDDGQSERLMLKYYDFMWQIRKDFENEGVNILSNLDKFPLKENKVDKLFYETVASAIERYKFKGVAFRKSRYYVEKVTPF